jgi:hypothetical protein
MIFLRPFVCLSAPSSLQTKMKKSSSALERERERVCVREKERESALSNTKNVCFHFQAFEVYFDEEKKG